MADTRVGLRLQTQGGDQVQQTVGNIRKELRQAQQEAVAISQRFGETSAEALEAARKVAILRDTIADTNERVALFDPGARFAAFGNVLRTVAGGFSALTGAVALFGEQSQEVEKALLKVQAALAITEGVNTIVDAGKDFERLQAIILQTSVAQRGLAAANTLTAGTFRLLGISVAATSTAFQVLRAAIIATGIGALIIAVGFLVEKLVSLASTSDDAADAQERLAEAAERANKAFDEQVGFLDRTNELNIKRAKAAGATEAEITELERKAIQDRIALRNEEISRRIAAGEDIKAVTEANNKDIQALQNFDLDQEIKRNDRRKQLAEQAGREAVERFNERIRQQREALEAEQALLDKLTGAGDAVDTRNTIRQEQREAELAANEEFAQRNIDLVARASATIAGINKETADKNIAAADAEKQAKVALYQAAQDGVSALIDIVGRQTTAGKVLALAQIATDTALAISGAVRQASTNPLNLTGFAFVADLAARVGVILANVAKAKQILSSGNPAGGGAVGFRPSFAAANPNAPQFAVNPIATTRLDQDTLNAIGNAASRAFVVESDITGNQERIRRLNRAARVG